MSSHSGRRLRATSYRRFRAWTMWQGSCRPLTQTPASNLSRLRLGIDVLIIPCPAWLGRISHQGASVSSIKLSPGIDRNTFRRRRQENMGHRQRIRRGHAQARSRLTRREPPQAYPERPATACRDGPAQAPTLCWPSQRVRPEHISMQGRERPGPPLCPTCSTCSSRPQQGRSTFMPQPFPRPAS